MLYRSGGIRGVRVRDDTWRKVKGYRKESERQYGSSGIRGGRMRDDTGRKVKGYTDQAGQEGEGDPRDHTE